MQARGALTGRSHLITRAVTIAPAALLALFYTPSVASAYRLDDYAWLSLPNTIRNGHSLLWALFSPQAQGSIRPLGERVWFLLASSLFGLNPLPFHLLALFTQIANAFLVVAVGRRLLGSGRAAAFAATLWVLNDSIVEPLVWASAYNEILYTFWLLLAFYAFLRWIDSAGPAWLAVHIAAIVLGFATLELMVTFPAIAAAYLMLFARKHWKTLLPSATLAAVFVIAHLVAARLPQSGPYRMSFGPGLLSTFMRYWSTVLGPEELRRIYQSNAGLTLFGTVLLSASIVAWVIIGAVRRQWIGLFGLLWFILALLPLLPLREHFTPYYTFLPLVGLAWLAGDALVWAGSRLGKSLALVCTVIYCFCQIPSTIFVRDWYRNQSSDVERRERLLFNAAQQIRRAQPDGPLFLDGVDTEQFWWGLCYGELFHRGFRDLHILPDAAKQGVAIPPREWCLDPNFQLPAGDTTQLLRDGRGHAYNIGSVPPRILPVKTP